MTILAAVGIGSDGKKRILGIAEGGSENSTIAKGLFEDLIHRGLDASRLRLYVIDGGKPLHKAVMDTFGIAALIQHCQVHKKPKLISNLPEFEYEAARSKLMDIAGKLEQRQAFWKNLKRH